MSERCPECEKGTLLYQPAEEETLAGRDTRRQYEELWFCNHCDATFKPFGVLLYFRLSLK